MIFSYGDQPGFFYFTLNNWWQKSSSSTSQHCKISSRSTNIENWELDSEDLAVLCSLRVKHQRQIKVNFHQPTKIPIRSQKFLSDVLYYLKVIMIIFHALATLCPLSKVYVQTFATFATFAALCLDFRRLNFGSRLRNMGRSWNTAGLSKSGHVAYLSIRISNGTPGPRINNGTQQYQQKQLTSLTS